MQQPKWKNQRLKDKEQEEEEGIKGESVKIKKNISVSDKYNTTGKKRHTESQLESDNKGEEGDDSPIKFAKSSTDPLAGLQLRIV